MLYERQEGLTDNGVGDPVAGRCCTSSKAPQLHTLTYIQQLSEKATWLLLPSMFTRLQACTSWQCLAICCGHSAVICSHLDADA